MVTEDVDIQDLAQATGEGAYSPRRVLQLTLAAIWLLDGLLQLQSFMFMKGSNGFSGMLASMASGNPGWIARSITWNASLVNHHAVLLNSLFALVQICIGIGIAWKPLLRYALGISIAWSLGVWWFGEGLGGVLHGAGSPLLGGPGAVLFYALIAVLVWPKEPANIDAPFVAAQALRLSTARIVWVATWIVMALLSVDGSSRSGSDMASSIQALNSGQPGWLGALDRHTASFLSSHGATVAWISLIVFLVVAAAIFAPPKILKIVIVVVALVFVAVWVLGENFGTILAGGATDPNSGPLVVLFAATFWPLVRTWNNEVVS